MARRNADPYLGRPINLRAALLGRDHAERSMVLEGIMKQSGLGRSPRGYTREGREAGHLA